MAGPFDLIGGVMSAMSTSREYEVIEVHMEPSYKNDYEFIVSIRYQITLLGGFEEMSKENVIEALEKGTHKFFTEKNGHKAYVEVAERNGKKYIKTKPDNWPDNNLLSLPRF